MKTNEIEVEVNGNKVTITLTDEQIKKLQVKNKAWYEGREFKEMYMPIGNIDGIHAVDVSEYLGGKDMKGAGFEPQRVFDNMEQAVLATDYLNLFIEMYNFCQLRNGANKIEWGNGNSKYILRVYGIHNGSYGIHVERFTTDCIGVFGLAVLTKEHAEEMLSIFGDRIKEVYSKLQNY